MKVWEAVAWVCAAVILTQAAVEVRDTYMASKAVQAPAKAVKPVQYDTGLWQEGNTDSVAACKAAVETIGTKAGLTVQDMRSDALKGIVGRAMDQCVLQNGLSI